MVILGAFARNFQIARDNAGLGGFLGRLRIWVENLGYPVLSSERGSCARARGSFGATEHFEEDRKEGRWKALELRKRRKIERKEAGTDKKRKEHLARHQLFVMYIYIYQAFSPGTWDLCLIATRHGAQILAQILHWWIRATIDASQSSSLSLDGARRFSLQLLHLEHLDGHWSRRDQRLEGLNS